MNGPNAIDHDLERRIRLWMSEPSADHGDARLMAAVAAKTRAMSQDRGIRARLGRSASRARSDRPRPRTILALAALLTTVGVAWLIGAGARQADPEPPTYDMEVYPRLTDELPAGAETGTFETPLGPARWVHLVGDLSSWPVDPRPLPGPNGGLLALDLGGSHPECEVVLEEGEDADGTGWMKVEDCPSPPGLWSSEDGLTWVRRKLPVPGADALDVVGDAYWLRRSDDRSGLWRSRDGIDWTAIDLTALVPPKPDDLDWFLEFGVPVTVRGTTVVPVTWLARDTGRLLGLPNDEGRFGILEEAGPGRYEVGGLVDESVLRTIQVAVTPDGLRISDATTGQPLSRLDGVGTGFVERWAANDEIIEQQVAVIDDGAAIPLSLPGEPLPPLTPGWDGVRLFGAPASFVAFARLPDGGVRTWHSADGRTWQEDDALRFDGRLARDVDLSIESRPGQRPVVVAYTAGQGWESSDGRTWHLAELDPEGDRALRVPAGWLSTAYGSFKVRAPDGEWTELGDTIAPDVRSGSGGRIGDTLVSNIVSRRDGVPRQDLWIIQFETDVPSDALP